MSKKLIKSIFVLGSTSYVAKDICRELAKRGCKKFTLYSRNIEKNKQFEKELKNKYDLIVDTGYFDLLDKEQDLPDIDNHDLYLITVGMLGDGIKARYDSNEALKIINLNFTKLVPWITKITSDYNLARTGRLWVFSSVASDIGRPSNYHYGAAKAALTKFCEGILYRSYKKPFCIRIIKAGYLATPQTLSLASEKLCMRTNDLAKKLLDSPNKRGIEYLPSWWFIVMMLLRIFPSSIISKL